MATHNNNISQLDLYEGDQCRLYSGVLNEHAYGDIQSEASKKVVRKIWMITLYLSIITIAEVSVGLISFHSHFHNYGLITYFLILTIAKAYFIVKVFMHLGDESNNFVMMILSPLILLVWIVISFLMDGDFGLLMNSTFGQTIKDFLP